MHEKDANFVTSQNPSYCANGTWYHDASALPLPQWKYMLQKVNSINENYLSIKYLLTYITYLLTN